MVHRRHQYWSKYFCDRKEETRQLLQLLENGNNVSLIAPRRIGKTELIENLKVMQKFTGILNSLRSGISFDAMGNQSWNAMVNT